jgi:uncharacterized protein (DUF2236 family)
MDLAKRSPDTPLGFDVPHRVNAERVVLLGWSRAILLQLAHPLVAAGVYEHSSFRATPWAAAARLHSTVRAMLALTFGTDAEREHALHGIRTIHRRVHGRLEAPVGIFPAGTPYSAEDPALVLWVHLTLLESIPLVYELFVAPLTVAERDEYCDGAAWIALALGANAAEVPRTWNDTQATLSRTFASGAIAAGPQARELGAAVLAPRIGSFIPPASWLNRLITVGLLPPAIRQQYGLPWEPGHQKTLERVISSVRAVRNRVPGRVALWPEARG